MIFSITRRLHAWWSFSLRFDQASTYHQADELSKADTAHSICCAHCLAVITASSHRIEVNGHHEHTCKNPAGMVFQIVLFQQAQCQQSGEPAEAYTWFPGFSWQVAYCHQCGVHLGWLYSAAQSPGFYGLIKSHLILVAH